MVTRYDRGGIRVVQGDARAVSQTIEPGSCSLAILDGPYGLGKAAWDRVSDLPAWYAPHLDDVDRVCGASASLYAWNTAEGWAALHPGIVARGWTFRALVTWNKPNGQATKSAHEEGARTWPDVTEVCGFYQREPANDFAETLTRRREMAGMTRKDLAALFPSRTGGLTGCVTNWEQGLNVPTREQWCAMNYFMMERSHATVPMDPGMEYDHLRAEYEASRPAFTCPLGVGNVWTHGQVTGSERLRAADGSTLHPCQKPLAFAERMIRASTRPGERVWVPFGGTCREAIAAQRIARADPAEAREVVTAELDEDGRDYLGAVVRVLEGRGTAPPTPGQVSLW